MRLSDFIDANIDPILDRWVAFARKQEGADGMNLTALRDHSAEMLRTIAADLRTPQSEEEQLQKSEGEAPPEGKTQSAAQSHGGGRARDGFTVGEMMAEFRALRASVLNLWTETQGEFGQPELRDLMRFNEAIDQALVESVAQYAGAVDQSHDLFVAILGHELRTPLQTVTLVIEHLRDARLVHADHLPLVERAVRSTKRMGHMLSDLVDFTRSRQSVGVAINAREVDLTSVVGNAVDEMRTVSPHHTFDVHLSGNLSGQFDGARICQVLINLLGNAVQHGPASAPVVVTAKGEPDQIVLEVRNTGPAIDALEMPALFSPFKRLRRGGKASDTHHLGLGLFIANQIVAAHGGRVEVASSDELGTRFVAHLPRTAPSRKSNDSD